MFLLAKDLNIALLLDFYGELLTEKQRDMIELYYDEDLSLGEIAETAKITRQGVRDSIKRGEQQLFEYEEKLGLAAKFQKISELLEKIDNLANDINKESTTYNYPTNIPQRPEITSLAISSFVFLLGSLAIRLTMPSKSTSMSTGTLIPSTWPFDEYCQATA